MNGMILRAGIVLCAAWLAFYAWDLFTHRYPEHIGRLYRIRTYMESEDKEVPVVVRGSNGGPEQEIMSPMEDSYPAKVPYGIAQCIASNWFAGQASFTPMSGRLIFTSKEDGKQALEDMEFFSGDVAAVERDLAAQTTHPTAFSTGMGSWFPVASERVNTRICGLKREVELLKVLADRNRSAWIDFIQNESKWFCLPLGLILIAMLALRWVIRGTKRTRD
jgi:hypothetical protein